MSRLQDRRRAFALKHLERNKAAYNLSKFLINKEKIMTPEIMTQEDKLHGIIGHKLWSSEDGKSFFAVAETSDVLPPDVYEPLITAQGTPYFYRINFSTEDLIRFSDSNIDKVVTEITDFWSHKKKFEEFGFPYRRGMLLHGPAGSGKSCALKLIIKDVIQQGGIGVRFADPHIFVMCMRIFRLVQPTTPVVAILEDLDGLMDRFDESAILNVLDGIDSFENMVYLATTNYPEELEGRIKNRPSRFDRRFEIGFPSINARKQYIKFLVGKVDSAKKTVDVDIWAEDTEEFTIAHIKELFISVVLFEHKYEESLKTLREMKRTISSSDYERNGRAGFGRAG